MDILFQNRKLEKVCNNQSLLNRTYGQTCAKLIRQRLDDLRAADCLETMSFFPRARCHELTGNRKGRLAVDVQYPYRLIFEPAHDPIPKKVDGGLDWKIITVIRILDVENYHD